MQYGKIVDGGIYYAPTNYENILNFNTNEELMREHGFKPVYDTPCPQYNELFEYVEFEWVETDEIRKVWEIQDRPKEDVQKDIDKIQLTPSDVERALYKAKKMNFAMLKSVIQQTIPNIDMIALDIEFNANTFYRGATFGDNDTRLFDVIGALLGYTPEDMNYLFLNKKLPEILIEENNEDTTDEPSDENPNLESELEL